MTKWKLTLLTVISSLSLTACVPLFVVGGTGFNVAADTRSIPEQWQDSSIRHQALLAINDDKRFADSHIDVATFNNNVLLTGQTRTASTRVAAEKAIRKIEGIEKIYNEIRIAEPLSHYQRSKDSLITSRVKFFLFSVKYLPSWKVKVVTENREVFLIGRLSKDEAQMAVEAARRVDGVKQIIKLFDIYESDKAAGADLAPRT